jgi:hypothetical protein
MPVQRYQYFSPTDAARMGKLQLVARQVVEGVITGLPQGLHQLAERLPRRSMLILISDLWTEPEQLSRALQHLRYRRHEALVIHLLDHAEMELPYDRQVTLEDLETKERIQIDPQLCLTGLLTNLPGTPMSQVNQWLPDAWKNRQAEALAAAAIGLPSTPSTELR